MCRVTDAEPRVRLRLLQSAAEDPLDKYCGDNPDADECRCDLTTAMLARSVMENCMAYTTQTL